MQRTLKLLPVFCLFCSSVFAGDWPRFHGPNGTGSVTGEDVPVEWTKKNVLWKTKIPGRGKSSPIVSRGNVFLQTASEDGAERIVYCINAKNGTVAWKKSIAGKKAHTHRLNTLASSTACADGEQVYFAIWDGTTVSIYAWDYKGNAAWKKELGEFRSQHGPGGSPIVYNGIVYYAFDMDGLSRVTALDAKDGTIKWRTPRRAYRACYSAPFLLKDGVKEPQLIITSTDGFGAYDPESGKEIWRYTWTHPNRPLRTVASPGYVDGVLLATSGNGAGNRKVIAVKPGTKGEVPKGNLLWTSTRSFPYVPSILAHGKYFYTVHDRGTANCHIAKTGEQIWQKRLGGAVSSSPVMINGNVYAASENGTVYVFKAAPEFKMLAKNELGERFTASPAVADDCLFLRGDEHLFCIGSK